jgi:hypothetical protein
MKIMVTVVSLSSTSMHAYQSSSSEAFYSKPRTE